MLLFDGEIEFTGEDAKVFAHNMSHPSENQKEDVLYIMNRLQSMNWLELEPERFVIFMCGTDLDVIKRLLEKEEPQAEGYADQSGLAPAT